MNTNKNMLKHKIIGASTLCALGAFAFLPLHTADARLIFSTEFESSTEDLNGDGKYQLSFGSDLAGEISYDENSDSFLINKSTKIEGDATVTGNSTLKGATDIKSTLNVDGVATMNNGLNVTAGDTNLNNTTVNGTLHTTGAASLDSTLNVDGAATLENTLTVNGSTTLHDGLNVSSGNTSLRDTTVDGNFTATGTATLNDNLTVGGTSTLQGATEVQSTLDVTGATNLKSTLSLDGNFTINNDSQIINLRAENKSFDAAPDCADASDLGRIFYDTTSDELLYCSQSGSTFGWSSTSGDAVNATATYYAEFANFSVSADGSNNIGTMVSEYDDTENRSFYKWSTRKTTANDYDVVLQWQVPMDFKSFQTNSLQVDHKEGGSNASFAISVEDSLGNNLKTVAVSNSDEWMTESVDLTSAAVSAGDTLTFKFKMTAQKTEDSFLSNVKLNYVQK
ncbi:hypothetical protein CSB37_03185 [bacterium DOLZORAL124_38_8]|nr:MAG: hypothetical protein CSB37_03185 [bacterium DOLZORAL124_38_8]